MIAIMVGSILSVVCLFSLIRLTNKTQPEQTEEQSVIGLLVQDFDLLQSEIGLLRKELNSCESEKKTKQTQTTTLEIEIEQLKQGMDF